LHLSVPFATQHRAGLQVDRAAAQVHGVLSGLLRGNRAIEQTLALGIQISQVIDLQPVGQNAKHQMAGQVRGRLPPEYGMPAGAKRTDVEIAQTRNLAVECLPVRDCRTDLNARHHRSGRPTLGRALLALAGTTARNLVDPLIVHLLGAELQLEALAHHARKEAPYRVLLPAGCLHHRYDCCSGRGLQHRDDAGLLRARIGFLIPHTTN
jgi:hypothetical protein